MTPTPARLLRLLALLQTRRDWSGAELADRLDVDPRTVRRDVDRLRALGYAIDASAGPGGGYRFGAGQHMPPLLLDDDEAVAVMLALRAAGGGFARLEETAMRALLKLEQIVPRRVRARLAGLQAVLVTLGRAAEPVDPGVLTALAAACRDHDRLGFTYRDHTGAESARRVEPMRVAHTGRRWYLVAWDSDRTDWRTFRVDRIRDPVPGARFESRALPGDVAEHVSRAVQVAPYACRARVELSGSAEDNSNRVPGWLGVIEAIDDTRCALTVGAPDEATLIGHLVFLGVDFTLVDPPALAPALRRVAARLQAAAAAPPDAAIAETR